MKCYLCQSRAFRELDPSERERLKAIAREKAEEKTAEARRMAAEAAAAEQSRLERERKTAEAAAIAREEELALIAKAKAIEAERKHQVELSWAKRVLAEQDGAEPSQNGRRSIPKAMRHSVWRRDGGACVDCDSKESLEFDHIIPVAMGGANTERNLQLLCEACNRRKGKSLN